MSENQAGQVLTNENAAEFYAQKLGLAQAEPSPVAVEENIPTEPEVVEAEGSEPVAEEAQAQEEPKKANPKLERRFSDLTKQREEARKEAQREREQRLELERKIAELQQQAPKAPVADVEPQPSQFQDAFEYAKALAEYTADKRIEEMRRQEAEAKVAQERQKVIDSWAQRVQAAKAEMPDFDEMVASSEVVVSDAVRDSILESDVGPQILYHLAENEELARKIAGMNDRSAVKELGKLEARFEKKPEEVKPVVRSKAPPPATPIRAAAGVADMPLDSDGRFYGSYAQWKAMRQQGKIR